MNWLFRKTVYKDALSLSLSHAVLTFLSCPWNPFAVAQQRHIIAKSEHVSGVRAKDIEMCREREMENNCAPCSSAYNYTCWFATSITVTLKIHAKHADYDYYCHCNQNRYCDYDYGCYCDERPISVACKSATCQEQEGPCVCVSLVLASRKQLLRKWPSWV